MCCGMTLKSQKQGSSVFFSSSALTILSSYSVLLLFSLNPPDRGKFAEPQTVEEKFLQMNQWCLDGGKIIAIIIMIIIFIILIIRIRIIFIIITSSQLHFNNEYLHCQHQIRR